MLWFSRELSSPSEITLLEPQLSMIDLSRHVVAIIFTIEFVLRRYFPLVRRTVWSLRFHVLLVGAWVVAGIGFVFGCFLATYQIDNPPCVFQMGERKSDGQCESKSCRIHYTRVSLFDKIMFYAIRKKSWQLKKMRFLLLNFRTNSLG